MTLVLNKPTTQGNILQAAKTLFSREKQRMISRSPQAGAAVYEGVPSNGKFINKLIAWEQGELSEAETLAFFQEFVSCGLAWKATGPARRTAVRLLREGLIHR